MNIARKVVVGVIIVVCATSSFFGVVNAQSPLMTDAQVDRIRVNCVSAKNTLNQLRTSDTLLRINRGQTYEYMSTKLMDRFNSRTTNSQINNADLILHTQTYSTALAAFRISYQSYGEQILKAINIDCSKEPVSFYDAVANARTKRTQVHTDVLKLHQHIDEYRSAVDVFKASFVANRGDS